ncbi:MAG: Ig domain-containing protein, partial [Planctomycetota bacterium]|nr:Ig domain-containing protein [Planctomycetota bacterium]
MGKMWRLGVVLVLISLGSCIHGKKTGPEDITITTTALPDGTIGEAYTAKLEATRRHKGIDLSWSLEGGSLPNGLIMNANGYITGVPTKSGTFEFIVKVVDNYDQNKDVKNLSITITGMQITTTSLPDGVVGVAYIQTLQVAGGGGASLTWSIASGALPDGLSLAASSGIINGLPSKEGTFSFVARVVDTNNNEASKALSITIAPSPITI